jgi:hypothetical protein
MRPTTYTLTVTLGLLLTACVRPVRPGDMSAQAHRAEAAKEQAAAAEHQREYDPTAVAQATPTPRDPMGVTAVQQASTAYNPTEWHLREAAAHSRHAREHDQAARTLENAEDRACRGTAPNIRASCPFLGPLRAVEDIPGGVRLQFAPKAPVEELAAYLQCYYAHARAQAYEIPSCPLALRDVTVTHPRDALTIELTSSDRHTARELRTRIRALFSVAGAE